MDTMRQLLYYCTRESLPGMHQAYAATQNVMCCNHDCMQYYTQLCQAWLTPANQVRDLMLL